MKTLYYLILTSVIAGFGISSCSDGESAGNDYEPIRMTAQTRATAEKMESFYVEFAKDAFRMRDSRVEDDRNRVVSPVSASMLLGMCANGASGKDREQIVGFLGVDDVESVNELSAMLMRELPVVDRRSELKLTNVLWTLPELTLRQGSSR